MTFDQYIHVWSRHSTNIQGCHSQEKCLENEIFSRSGKSQGILWIDREI